MKILLVSSLRRKLDPNQSASRTRLIYNLALGLIKRGHKVSILTSQNSIVKGATIIPILNKDLSELPPFENQFYAEISYLVCMAKIIQEKAADFDIIHNHTYPEYINLLVEQSLTIPMVTTLHAPVTSELENVLSFFPKSNIVSQSKTYQGLVKTMNIPWVVNSGIDENLFTYSDKPRNYLLWVGRLGKARDERGVFLDGKGIKDAIAVSRKLNKKLILLGNVEDMDFYNKEVAPFLSSKILWASSLSSRQTQSEEVCKMMQGAKVLLFPTKFEESFGLVAAEAMACGTPVVAYSKGSLPDIIKNNQTGFLVNPAKGVNGLCQAVKKIYSMDKITYQTMQKNARAHVEQNFTIDKMVENYQELYNKLLNN